MNIELESAALRRLAGALTADSAAAEDLVQDTWVAALRAAPDQDRPVRPWLSRVLRNRHISSVRSSQRAQARSAKLPPDPPKPSLEQIQVSKRLIEEIEALPETDAELIVMRYWEGLDASECGARLEVPASTVRTRLKRALDKLRARLDRGQGGRAAWMAALLPMVDASAVTKSAAAKSTSAGTLNAKTLTVGGVVAATVLWLAAALPHGCEVEGETAAPEGADRTASPSREDARAAGAPPQVASETIEAAPEADEGDPVPRPPDDSVDLSAYRSPTGPGGGVHPQLAVSMALRGVWDEVGTCHALSGPGRARITTSVRFEGDGQTSFDSITFGRVSNFPEAEQECVRQTVAARELEVKKVDVTQLGFSPDATLSYELTADLTLEDAEVQLETVHYAPGPGLQTLSGDRAPLREAIARCGGGLVEVELRFEPSTRALAQARPTGDHAETDQGRCVAAAVRAHVAPTWYFEPAEPDHEKLACRFGLDPSQSERGYVCENLGSPDPHAPHPIEP